MANGTVQLIVKRFGLEIKDSNGSLISFGSTLSANVEYSTQEDLRVLEGMLFRRAVQGTKEDVLAAGFTWPFPEIQPLIQTPPSSGTPPYTPPAASAGTPV